jgi:hypothetical protein
VGSRTASLGRTVLTDCNDVDRRPIAVIWLGGIVLMVAIYAFGPQHFIVACEQFIANATSWLSSVIETLMLRAFEVVRAAAIAMYVVFLVLAILAVRAGLRIGGMLVVVSVVFLLLVRTDWYGSDTRWFAAAVLTAVAAAVLTQRLIHAPGPRNPADPWGMALRRGGKRSGSPQRPSDLGPLSPPSDHTPSRFPPGRA